MERLKTLRRVQDGDGRNAYAEHRRHRREDR